MIDLGTRYSILEYFKFCSCSITQQLLYVLPDRVFMHRTMTCNALHDGACDDLAPRVPFHFAQNVQSCYGTRKACEVYGLYVCDLAAAKR